MFRRTLLASVGAVALTGSAALAADLPSRAPPPVYLPPPPIFSWTGLYVGINAGYTWSNSNTVDTDGAPIFANPAFPLGASSIAAALAIVGTTDQSVSSNGFIGGGQIGYNFQFANSWVVGLEADIQGIAGTNKSATIGAFTGVPNFPAESYTSTATVSKRTDYLGTVRGRLGFLVTPTLLAYGTGGLAYGGVNASTSFAAAESLGPAVYPPVFATSSFSNTRVGWTAGGGLEWLFAPNWSLKVEYLYYDLGTVSSNLILTQINNTAAGGPAPWGVAAVRSSTRFNGNIVRAGLNYHFNLWGPAPIVAKY
jgi:outer membrane immunogenic protein